MTALQRQQHKLMRKIARKQEQIAEFTRECREFHARMATRLQPLLDRASTVNDEIHTMFRRILTRRKLGKRSYQAILEVYESLQDSELITPRPFDAKTQGRPDGTHDGEPDEPDIDTEEGDDWHIPRSDSPRNHGARTGGVRDLFLQLASRFHPDIATSADLQHQHTEIMKEVNRAYSEGDVARLLEIKSDLEGRGMVELAELSPEERCARLQDLVDRLQEQLRTLAQELAAVHESPMGELFMEYRRLQQRRVANPMEVLMADARLPLQLMEVVHAFVAQFHARKMTIKRFLEGPAVFRFSDDGDDVLLELDLELVEVELSRRFSQAKSRACRRGRRR